jgi:hypothetical protein
VYIALNFARRLRAVFVSASLSILCVIPPALAQSRPSSVEQAQNRSDAGSRVSAEVLTKQVVKNELNAQINDKSQWKFREFRVRDGKREVLEVVDTPAGEVHRLIAVNGKPLSPAQQAQEERRIQKLLADHDEWQKRQQDRHQDAEQERKLLGMLPTAFRYQYAGRSGGFVRLRFTPNPEFRAHSHESEVFHHMAGVMLIDPHQKRLAEIDGRLLTRVEFGAGLLGHLDQGGTFSVKQADMGGGHWEMTQLNVKMDGKALFFKTIAVRQQEIYAHYQPVAASLTLAQAADILRKDAAS